MIGPGLASQTEHLLFVYEAADPSPAEFTITGHGGPGPWPFYSCDINPLK